MTKEGSRYGVLKVFARTGERFTEVPLTSTVYTIGSDERATIKVCRSDVDPVHCELRVFKETGLALLVNGSTENPVPINDKSVPKEMFLMPHDTFLVMGKKFLYENPHLTPKVLREAKMKNLENIKKMKRITTGGRLLLTPQPEKNVVLKPRRSSSLDNQHLQTPAQRARQLCSELGSSSLHKVDPSKSNRLHYFNGFAVSTPESAVKPSLRNATIFKNLSTMSYTEPECEESTSTSNAERSEESTTDASVEQRQEMIKTPVVDLVDAEDELAATPLNNTSIITVTPLKEDETSLRSRKSKAREISIQRLTKNDDSVITLDTPDYKTPKSALKNNPTKTPIGSMMKTKLMDEYAESDEESTAQTEGTTRNEEVTEESDVIEIGDSSMDSSNLDDDEGNISGNVVEASIVETDTEEITVETTQSSSELKPSRQSTGIMTEEVIKTVCLPTAKDSANGFSIDSCTPDSKSVDFNTDSCEKEFGVKTPLCSTPAPRKSVKKLEESFKQVEVTDEASATENSSMIETTETSDNDVVTGVKRKKLNITSDTSYTNNDNKRFKYVDSESTLADMCSFSSEGNDDDPVQEGEADELSTISSPAPNLLTRKCVTEPRQTRRSTAITRRSLSDRMSNQENEPMEASDTTLESVDTSSFVYVKNNVAFETSEFASPIVPQRDEKKSQKEPLNDLTDVAGVKKLMQTPRVAKEPLNDLSSPSGVKQLMKTPKTVKNIDDTDVNLSGVKALMNTPAAKTSSTDELLSLETTSVFNVSGVSALQDDEEDIFPAKRVTRTYGRSLPANSKSVAGKMSRKTEGFAAEVTPDVQKWVEKSSEYLTQDEVAEDTDATKTPAKSVRKSLRIVVDENESSTSEGFEVKSKESIDSETNARATRGRSLPVAKTSKPDQHKRKTLATVSVAGATESFSEETDLSEHLENTDIDDASVPSSLTLHIDTDESKKESSYSTSDTNVSTEITEDSSVPSWKSSLKSIHKSPAHTTLEKEDDEQEGICIDLSVADDEPTDVASIDLEPEDEFNADDSIDVDEEELLKEDHEEADSSVTKASEEQLLDEDEEDQEEEVELVAEKEAAVEECVVFSQKRKSIRKASDETGEDDVSEVVVTHRMSSRKSIQQIEDNAESTEQEEIFELENEDASDVNEEVVEPIVGEPEMVSRKSLRKSTKKMSNDVAEEETLDLAVEADANDVVEEPEVVSRKSLRKSSKKILNDATEEGTLDLAVEADAKDVVEEPEVVSRKSLRKSSKKISNDATEGKTLGHAVEADANDVSKEPEVVSRKSLRKSSKKISNDATEEEILDLVADEVANDVAEESEFVSRKSLRKSSKMVSSELEEERETVVSSPKSHRHSETTIETSEQEEMVELVQEEVAETTNEDQVCQKRVRNSTQKAATETNEEEDITDVAVESVDNDESIDLYEHADVVTGNEDENVVESEVTSRKNLRKSIKDAVLNEEVDESNKADLLEEEDTTVTEEQVISPSKKLRKSSKKSLMDSANAADESVSKFQLEEEAIENIQDSENVQEEKENQQVTEEYSDEVNTEKLKDEDNTEPELSELTPDEKKASTRKSITKTTDDEQSADITSTVPPRKSSRKSLINKQDETNTEPIAKSPRKSVVASEKTVSSTVLSPRKSARKSNIKAADDSVAETSRDESTLNLVVDQLDTDNNTPQMSGRRSGRRSLAKSMSADDVPAATPKSERKLSLTSSVSKDTPATASKRRSKSHESTPLSASKAKQPTEVFATPALPTPKRSMRAHRVVEQEVTNILDSITPRLAETTKEETSSKRSARTRKGSAQVDDTPKLSTRTKKGVKDDVAETKSEEVKPKRGRQANAKEEEIVISMPVVLIKRSRGGLVSDAPDVKETNDKDEESVVEVRKSSRRGKKVEKLLEAEKSATSVEEPVGEAKKSGRSRREQKVEPLVELIEKPTRSRRGRQGSDTTEITPAAIPVKKTRRGAAATSIDDETSEEVEELPSSVNPVRKGGRKKQDTEETVENTTGSQRGSALNDTDTPEVKAVAVPVKRSRRGKAASPVKEDLQETEVIKSTQKSTRGRPRNKKEESNEQVEDTDVVETPVKNKNVDESETAKKPSTRRGRRGVIAKEAVEIEKTQEEIPEVAEKSKKTKKQQTAEKKATTRRGGRRGAEPIEEEVGTHEKEESLAEIPEKKASKQSVKKGRRAAESPSGEEQPEVEETKEVEEPPVTSKRRRGKKETEEPPTAKIPTKRSARRGPAQPEAVEEPEEVKESPKKPAKRSAKKASLETVFEEPAPKVSRNRKGKSVDVAVEELIKEIPTEATKKSVKRKRRGKEASPEPTEVEAPSNKRSRGKAKLSSEVSEIEEVVTRTNGVKGVKVTTVTLKKKVAFVEENPQALPLTPAPAKRRLRSEDELNLSDLERPTRKTTRGRK